MKILFTLRVFARILLRGRCEKIFSYFHFDVRPEVWTRSLRLTYYLLDYGFRGWNPFSFHSPKKMFLYTVGPWSSMMRLSSTINYPGWKKKIFCIDFILFWIDLNLPASVITSDYLYYLWLLANFFSIIFEQISEKGEFPL